MTNVEKIKAELKDAYAVLSALAPFVSSILHRLRIVLVETVETASVSERNELLISPKFWSGLTLEEKAWLLAHEAMHIAMRDLQRRGDRDPLLWNIAADAINNELLKQLGLPIERVERMYKWGVTLEKIGIGKNINITKEKLYELLKDRRYNIEPPRIQDLTTQQSGQQSGGSEDKTSGGSGRGSQDKTSGGSEDKRIVIQEGDPSIYDAADSEEIEKRIREMIRDAWMTAKMAGRSPAGLDRAIEELLKPRIDWRRLLRQSLEWRLPRVESTWKRPNRRINDLPGIRRKAMTRLYALIDVSGSIEDRVLSQFASEIYAVAKHSGGEVVVIPWDAEVQGVFKLKRPSDILRKVKFKGGGGTEIGPALEYVLPRIRRDDAVVVLTDGHIADINDHIKLLEELGRKAAVAVFVTTDATPPLPKTWRVIKIEI